MANTKLEELITGKFLTQLLDLGQDLHRDRVIEVRHQGVKVTTFAPGSVDTGFSGMPRAGDASWMLTPDDVANAILDLLRGRDAAHLSRVEMRPAQPQKKA